MLLLAEYNFLFGFVFPISLIFPFFSISPFIPFLPFFSFSPFLPFSPFFRFYFRSCACAAVVNVILGLMPYLDNFAHIGGIVMGFVMGLGLLVQGREDEFGERLEKKCYQVGVEVHQLGRTPSCSLGWSHFV